MKKTLALLALLAATVAQAQYTNSFTINPKSVVDVYITHKAHSEATWLATIAGTDLTDHTPITCGLKQSLADNTFFALSTGVVQSASAGTVLFEFPTSAFVTNITEDATLYGDIRLTDYDLPLPSLNVTLKPAANWGTETYVSPANHEYRTNGTSVGTARVIDFASDFIASKTNDVLYLGIGSVPDNVARAGVTTNAANHTAHTNTTLAGGAHGGELDPVAGADLDTHEALTLAGGAHGGETDPIWTAVSNDYAQTADVVLLTGDQTIAGLKDFSQPMSAEKATFNPAGTDYDTDYITTTKGSAQLTPHSGGDPVVFYLDGTSGQIVFDAGEVTLIKGADGFSIIGDIGSATDELTFGSFSEYTFDGPVDASAFTGDGSGLTGIAAGYRRAARSSAFSRTGADPETSAEADGNVWWTPDNAAAPESLDAYQLDLLPNETNVTVTAYWFADTTGTYQSVWYGGGTAQVTNTINITSTSATDPTVVSSSWSFSQSGGGRYPIYPSYTGGTAGDVIRTRFDVEVSR